MSSMDIRISELIEHGYIKRNGTPLKCVHCDSSNLITGEEYWGETGIEEYETICNDCKKLVGLWSYGRWCL